MTTIVPAPLTTALPVRVRRPRVPAAGSGRPPRHVLAAGFDVALHEGAARAARVVPGFDRLCVVVADRSSGSGGTAGVPVSMELPVSAASASCLVWCHLGGAVQVRASWSPPALLVTGDGTVMVPQNPGTPGLALMAPGDRLLVLSTRAYEAAPERMVRLLHERPGRLLAANADELVERLFVDVPEAGGAVITRIS